MIDGRIQELVDTLDELLENERAALLNGDLDRLARLHERKASLVEELNLLDEKYEKDLRPLGEKAQRNQALLKSALEGIRTVSSRLAAIRRVTGSLETYGADGRKTKLDIVTSKKVEKRA